MRDLISDVITCCLESCDAGKFNESDKIMFTSKARKYGNKRNFYIKLRLKDYVEIEFTAC